LAKFTEQESVVEQQARAVRFLSLLQIY